MSGDIINLQFTTVKDPLPDFIYDDLKQYSANSNGYKPQPKELLAKLSEKHNIEDKNIYLTAGVDEAIQMFAKAYGNNAYVFTPTYVVYSDVRQFGGKLTEIFSVIHNKFAISSKSIPNASLIYVANPNNPSGWTEKTKLIELIMNNPNAIVVVDEAYGDFAPELSVIDQIEKHKNLAVFRSFSKGYGMAGNRIGYILSSEEVISKVKDFTQWSNVSYLSVGAAISALNHEEYFSKMRNEIAKVRDNFIDFLRNKNYTVFDSVINAVLLKFDDKKDGIDFFNYLKKSNIVTSLGNGNSNIGLDESFVRIAIGNKDQMKIVKNIIK